MNDVTIADLEDPNRLAALFFDSQRSGLVKNCEAEKLAFFGAAERAKRIATRNVAGCFVHIVRHRCYAFIAQEDEERARKKVAFIRD